MPRLQQIRRVTHDAASIVSDRWNRSVTQLVARALMLGVATTIATSVATLPPLIPMAEAAPQTPPIRLSATNQVPACVTPDRLMSFLRSRNRRLIPRFRDIARWYEVHGEAWRVRWDYAFFQMALETNFLTYRQPNGRWGDVNPRQNNFAGLGTTGGGVPGDSYPDVSIGVLAQIQHLVAYSGERLDNPVGPRTRLKQDVIVKLSAPIARRRPVTFQDLSGRWAVDRKYGRSINRLASDYARRFCRGGLQALLRPAPRRAARSSARSAPPRSMPRAVTPAVATVPRPRPAVRPITDCRVMIASYGGTQTVLIGAHKGTVLELTALDIDPTYASAMTQGFIDQYARGGRTLGQFASRHDALVEAYRRCPAAAMPRSAQR